MTHNCHTQAAVLNITEVRYKTGLVSKLDVSQAKSVYYSTKASIPQLEAGINQYITTLAILLGTYPQHIRPILEKPGKLPDYMEPIGIGIPADCCSAARYTASRNAKSTHKRQCLAHPKETGCRKCS